MKNKKSQVSKDEVFNDVIASLITQKKEYEEKLQELDFEFHDICDKYCGKRNPDTEEKESSFFMRIVENLTATCNTVSKLEVIEELLDRIVMEPNVLSVAEVLSDLTPLFLTDDTTCMVSVKNKHSELTWRTSMTASSLLENFGDYQVNECAIIGSVLRIVISQ